MGLYRFLYLNIIVVLFLKAALPLSDVSFCTVVLLAASTHFFVISTLLMVIYVKVPTFIPTILPLLSLFMLHY